MTTTFSNFFYYDPKWPSGFSTLRTLLSAPLVHRRLGKNVCRSQQCLLRETGCLTLYRPVGNCFARNIYTVTNVVDVWECVLLDVHAYGKYNDNHKYIISVINVLLKFLHMIPVKTNSGPFHCLGDSVHIRWRDIYETASVMVTKR